MDEALRTRVEELLGTRVTGWARRAAPWQPPDGVPGGMQRFVVELADGRGAFVKHAPGGDMARWLRREQQVYASLRAPFLPDVLGAADGEAPILLLEDLSAAWWPPPWRSGDVDAVLATLADVRRLQPPPATPTLAAYESGLLERWRAVAADPEPFLSLGLVERHWLDRALPTLIDAAEAAPLDGEDLLHLDVRSDNLCLRGRQPVLVDWNHVCTGNGLFDVAFFLPSVAAEGGPQPHELAPEAAPLAAVVAGYFASVAGLPPPAFAPTVRSLQVAQLVPALAWARRELGL
jgi:hypothetical protein